MIARAKNLRRWNEEMFKKFGNERLYFHSNPLIRYIENSRVKAILNLLRVTDHVLDLGCGEAYILKQVNGRRVGVDLSSEALSLAKNRLKEWGVEGSLVMSDMHFLPFKRGCFDKVICSEVLEHIASPKRAVSEALRVLKMGGSIIFTVPDERRINQAKKIVKFLRLYHLFLKGVPERMDDQWHLHIFNLSIIKRIITESKELKISNIVKIPFFFPIRIIISCTLEV